MHLLQHLRQAGHITRFMLVWFVLSLGAAIASPIVNPQPVELICTSNGVMKVLVKNADGTTNEGGTEVASRMLDCPLCATAGAPPPAAHPVADPSQSRARVLQPLSAAPNAARTAALPPARGPPAFS